MIRSEETARRSRPGAGHRVRIIADARLCVVPLAVAASVAARDDALRDTATVVALAVTSAYAVGLWLTARSRWSIPGRLLDLSDTVVVLGLVAIADPRATAAGRVPLLLILGAWAILLPARRLAVRGAGVALFVGAVGLVRHDAATGARGMLLTLVVLVICAGIARRVAERQERIAALERRAGELQAEVAVLEERERARIAQLLHDDALQRLLAARQDLEQGLDGDADALIRATEGFAGATQALRNLTLVTHDSALQSAGLASAVQRIADEAATRARLTATVAVDPSLDGDLGPVVLPIVRELVANVERHAAASSLDVDVRRETGGLSVTVRDDGRGVRPAELAAAERAGHLGISSLTRRVEELQGTLEIAGHAGDGTRVRVVLADRHIRAHRALDEALRKERNWNAALVAGFPDPFVVTTSDLRVVEVSDGFLEATGWTRAELLGAAPARLPHLTAAQQAEILERWQGPDDDHRTYTTEEELLCRDGRRLDVLASVRHVRDPRGQRGLRLVTYKDISDRRAVERRLRAERDISHAITRVMREAYLQTLDGVIIEVNDAFCALTGYTREQLVGARRPYFFFPEAGLAKAFAFAEGVEQQGLSSARLPIRRADGMVFDADVVGVAVVDADRVRLGRVISARPAEPLPPLGPTVPLLPRD